MSAVDSSSPAGDSSTPFGKNHRALGIFLLILPFVLFALLVAGWPAQVSPDALSLEAAVQAEGDAAKVVEAADRVLVDPNSSEKAKGEANETKTKAAADVLTAKLKKEEAEKRLRERGSSAVTVSRWRLIDQLLGSDIEIHLLFLVIISAAIGSSVQAAKSFAAFTGTRQFNPDWNWWYFLRLPTGIGLALLLYFVVRGGFMTGSLADQSVAGSVVNPFGVAALSALAGMFSRQVSDKLQELFENLFRTAKTPVTPSLEKNVPPVAVGATGDGLKVKVAAKNIMDGATAVVGGQARTISAISAKGFTLELKPEDATSAKELDAKVMNSADKGGGSITFKIKVAEQPKSMPSLEKDAQPVALGATGDGLNVKVAAKNIMEGATVVVGGQARTISAISANGFTLELRPEDVASAKELDANVTNSADKGGGSMTFKIKVMLRPKITPAPQPPAVGATGAELEMNVKGEHFATGATGFIGGKPRKTTMPDTADPTALTVTLEAADVAQPGKLSLTVKNPAGLDSEPVELIIS
jgi:nitrogen fixation protein